MKKPFVHLVAATWEDWEKLIGSISENQRFRRPAMEIRDLCAFGRPLFISSETFDCHIYPCPRSAGKEPVVPLMDWAKEKARIGASWIDSDVVVINNYLVPVVRQLQGMADLAEKVEALKNS